MTEAHTRLNLSAAIASVSVALVLVVLKAWAVSQTQSLAVAASLADSVLDLLVSASALTAIAYAARPPDSDHRFGHSAAEDLAALGQALFLTGAATALVIVSLQRLISSESHAVKTPEAGITVMGISIFLTFSLILWQRHVASLTANRVVAADMQHYISDLLPTLGALLALFLSARFGIHGVDSLVALIAGGLLLVGAFRIGRGAWKALMGHVADPKIISGIEAIADDFPDVSRLHDLRSRTAGTRVFVDFHVEIDGDLPLREAHEIAAKLKRRILTDYPNVDLMVHVDPRPQT
ncbi:MAG: cation diffusion facilitator family transporter [Pseudomonadota bacterium]